MQNEKTTPLTSSINNFCEQQKVPERQLKAAADAFGIPDFDTCVKLGFAYGYNDGFPDVKYLWQTYKGKIMLCLYTPFEAPKTLRDFGSLQPTESEFDGIDIHEAEAYYAPTLSDILSRIYSDFGALKVEFSQSPESDIFICVTAVRIKGFAIGEVLTLTQSNNFAQAAAEMYLKIKKLIENNARK
jgi:hypothetical protein